MLVGFLDDHCSVDDRLIAPPEQASTLLPQVFDLFARMLDEGFVHMAPHPKNILIAPDGQLRLIDFECGENYLKVEQPTLDRSIFMPVFERFLTGKVSRTTRYAILTSPKAQAAFKAQ